MNTYAALKYLMADLPAAPGRRPLLALATTPLARGLVDVFAQSHSRLATQATSAREDSNPP